MLVLLALLAWPVTPASGAFDLETVAAKARALAAEPFVDPRGRVPNWLLDISYDQWRDIRFHPQQSLWGGGTSRFLVQFFHPGLFYDRAVVINDVNAQGVRPVAFSPSQFDYGENDFVSRVPQDLGYAGFRLHYPIKTHRYHDEVIVFLGASYFRAVGKHEGFGISARGLAIDTAAPSGEEFPYFKEFWLVRPSPEAGDMTLFALLDSPSLTGAYRFVVRPGEQTIVGVDLRLYRRRDVQKLGIAPLTSMFFYGENTVRRFDDYRTEVHDSDGLLLRSATGEWMWRPLDNPRTIQVSSFEANSLGGFGLMQRDRTFEHYQDLEARSEERPSVWVSPRGDWGPGRVELVELPTERDTNDNIVAFWVPSKLPPLPHPVTYSYTTSWFGDAAALPPGGRVIATRRDRGTKEDAYRFVIDFTGRELASIPADTVLQGVVTVGSGSGEEGEVVEQNVVKNPLTRGWRLVFQVRPRHSDPLELRAFLKRGNDALTETWTYVLVP